jgi:hypothetical protein
MPNNTEESIDLKTRALELYTPPFRYSNGYVFDSQNNMVADDDNVETSVVTRIRGWGKISYMTQAPQLQDKLGEMVAEALTDYWNKHHGKV